MLDNCFRFAPRDSIPGLIAKICKYLKDHPGWSEAELEEQIKKFISATGVESFNGRAGTVTLNKNDVNNLKIASAYFAEGNESIDRLDLVSLYNQGVRFVFTDFNSATSGYNLAFVLDYFSGSGDVVYYPMSTGSGGGGNIVSVNGKTGVVELSLSDIVGTSGVQVKLCTAEEFASTNTVTWNAYYNEGYRIVGVVNASATAIDYIYLLKQDENNHTPIALSTGASDAYTPNNPPPYPVSSVNGKTGIVGLKVVDVSNGNSSDENAYIFIDESDDYPSVVAEDSSKLGGKEPKYYLKPINILDNSDFTKFIAQAGIMGTHGGAQYVGDRWEMNVGTVTGVANNNGEGYTDITLQSDSHISQKINGIDKYYGKPMTAAIWLKNGSVIVGSGIVNAPTEDYQTPISAGDNGINIYVQATTGNERVYTFRIVTSGKSGTVVAAALIPGNYTADTLPKYVPKGYVVELAECQRYFWVCDNTYFTEGCGYAFSPTECRFIISTPQTMRISPSIKADNNNNTSYGIKVVINGAVITPTAVSVRRANNRLCLTINGKFTTNTVGVLRLEAKLFFSADL